MKRKPLQNVFSDSSSLVLRSLLRDLGKKWTTEDFAKEGLSFGLVSEVLNRAEALGYVERIRKGPGSYTRLIRKVLLIKDWLSSYNFSRNQQVYYLYPEKDFLKICLRYLKSKGVAYALTLFSASRLIAPYVKDDRHFIYLNLNRKELAPFLKELEAQINLYQLVQGGNVCFTLPFYQSSVFKDAKSVKGFKVVSDLQLYLDLMTFPPSGPEEAKHFASYLKRKGIPLV